MTGPPLTAAPPGTALLLALAALGAGGWAWVAWRGSRGKGAFAAGPSPPVPGWAGFAGLLAYVAPAALMPPPADAGPVVALARALLTAAAAACAVAAVWVLARRGGGNRRKDGDEPPFAVRSRDGGVAFLLALPPVLGLMAAAASVRTVEAGNPLLKSLLADPSPAAWGCLAASAVLFAPLGEELLFRGLLLGSLRSAGLPAGWAVAAAAGLFAALHPVQDWPPLFALGCVLGWARVRTGSLVPCVLAHALFNAAFLAQVALDGPAAFG